MNSEEYIEVNFSSREQLWKWATDNGIKLEYGGSINDRDFWGIENEQHRVLFALRWS